MISYHFNETDNIKKYLIELEAIKLVFDKAKILPQYEEKIRRESILKSSIYSAKIEGVTVDHQNETKIEIANLVKAYNYIYLSNLPQSLSINLIRHLHSLSMANISSQAGKFRQESWAIFDQSGNVVHLAPPFFEIPKLIDEYLQYLQSLNCHSVIKSAIAQFIFEKIHPFADGNGRTGRLISAYILRQNNYHLRGILPFEEYTDNHRQLYYYALEPSTDMTEFIEYFIKSLVKTGQKILPQLDHPTTSTSLLPRRQEILDIITDHPNCSFNFLARRFPGVNDKTLHYDLKKLIDQGLITKLGITRGALYNRS